MNTNTNTVATVVTFTAADGVDIELHSSRPSKDEAIKLGWLYAQASEKEQDEMLDTFGPTLIRRSLRAFGNFAQRQTDKAKWAGVPALAQTLRDEIKVLPVNAKVA